MAKILLIETATEVCGAAIAVDGKVLALHETPNSTDHSARLTLQIEACARDSGFSLRDLDAVAVSRGPGSYTSLRVGASVAKGICYALGKPLVAIDTLQALACASRADFCLAEPDFLSEPHVFAPMIDARRMEVCMAIYDAELREAVPYFSKILIDKMFKHGSLLLDESAAPFRCLAEGARTIFSGNGSEKAKTVLDEPRSGWSKIQRCSAAHLAELAEISFQMADFQSVAYFEPVYFKPPNIVPPKGIVLKIS